MENNNNKKLKPNLFPTEFLPSVPFTLPSSSPATLLGHLLRSGGPGSARDWGRGGGHCTRGWTAILREPGLIILGDSLARGNQERSRCQTAARSLPSGAIRLFPHPPFSQWGPGCSGKVRVEDPGAHRLSLLLTPCSCGQPRIRGFKKSPGRTRSYPADTCPGRTGLGCSLTVGEGPGRFLPSPFPRAARAGGVCRLFPSPSAELLLFLKLN